MHQHVLYRAVEEESDDVADHLEKMHEEITALQIENKALEDAILFREETGDQLQCLQYDNQSVDEMSDYPETRELTKVVLNSQDNNEQVPNLKDIAGDNYEKKTDDKKENFDVKIRTNSPQPASKTMKAIETLDNQLSSFPLLITTEDTKAEIEANCRDQSTKENKMENALVETTDDRLEEIRTFEIPTSGVTNETTEQQNDVDLGPLDIDRETALVNTLDASLVLPSSSANQSASAKPRGSANQVKSKSVKNQKQSAESKIKKTSSTKKK